jgi:hypothetical protein
MSEFFLANKGANPSSPESFCSTSYALAIHESRIHHSEWKFNTYFNGRHTCRIGGTIKCMKTVIFRIVEERWTVSAVLFFCSNWQIS